MTYVHPLNAADAERSAARIADIELGLTDPDPVAAEWWRAKARTRIRALEEDRMDYGLVPHEVAELARLKQLLGDAPTTAADVASIIITICLCCGLLTALAIYGQ